MKVVILAGGLGSRLLSSSRSLPKPMNKIGNIPIIIHIMDIYSNKQFKWAIQPYCTRGKFGIQKIP